MRQDGFGLDLSAAYPGEGVCIKLFLDAHISQLPILRETAMRLGQIFETAQSCLCVRCSKSTACPNVFRQAQ